jgi:hypothetical protein
MSVLDALLPEVLFHYVNHREFLVLIHSIPQIIISEKQQQKQHGVFRTHSSSNMPLLASRPYHYSCNKMSPCLSQVRNESRVVVVVVVVVVVRGGLNRTVANLKNMFCSC